MKVFLAGSLRLEFLDPAVQELMEQWREQSAEFLIGDAPGMDRTFQRFLADRNYQNVTVYCSDGFTRNNLGSWPVWSARSGLKSAGHARHAAKDRHMVDEADQGLMVWDSSSTGTIANLVDLLDQGKPCHLFIEGIHKSHRFLQEAADIKDLEALFPDTFAKARKRLVASRKRHKVLVGDNDGALELDWSGY